MRVTIESFMSQWLDQNVGIGPRLRADAEEARGLLRELLSDMAHLDAGPEDLDAHWLLHLIVDARATANSRADAGDRSDPPRCPHCLNCPNRVPEIPVTPY